MRYILYRCFLILTILTPPSAAADHDCIEGRGYGHQIKIKKHLPKNWFMIGDKLISDPELHSMFRSKFAKHYTVGSDEDGFTTAFFCGSKNGIYVNISNNDFGPSAEFSSEAPKCWKCTPIAENIEYLVSGTGLTIGLDKARVSSILGYTIKADTTSISFEAIEKGEEYDIWHSQTLRIEFRNMKLIRFSVDDHRERYN